MKRVLLVSYHFPPANAVGAVRPRGLYRFLPDYGWAVTVLTCTLKGRGDDWPGVIGTGYTDVIAWWRAHLGLRADRPLSEQVPAFSGGREARAPGLSAPHRRRPVPALPPAGASPRAGG